MFTYTWTPDIPGNHTVIATFSGSAGYYGSTAETSFYASPATTPAPTAPPASNIEIICSYWHKFFYNLDAALRGETSNHPAHYKTHKQVNAVQVPSMST